MIICLGQMAHRDLTIMCKFLKKKIEGQSCYPNAQCDLHILTYLTNI